MIRRKSAVFIYNIVIVMSVFEFSIANLFSFARNADGGGVEARAGQWFHDL
jgi:hypothetical protein